MYVMLSLAYVGTLELLQALNNNQWFSLREVKE